MTRQPTTALQVRLEGPSVAAGAVLVNDFLLFVQRLQACVNHIALSLLGRTFSKAAGRFPKEVETACALQLVAIRPGSFEVGFAVSKPVPEEQRTLFPANLGVDALEKVVETVAGFQHDECSVPVQVPVSAIRFLRDISGIVDQRISAIHFSMLKPRRKQASITPPVRKRIESHLLRPYITAVAVEGVLRELDLERNKCQVFMTGMVPFIRCEFDEQDEEQVKAALDQWVRIHGDAVTKAEDGRIQTLKINYIEILDDRGRQLEITSIRALKAGEILLSPLLGIWADRTDIRDAVSFARTLRERASRRSQ